MAGPECGKLKTSGENCRLGNPGDVSICDAITSALFPLATAGVDIRLPASRLFLTTFATRDSVFLRLEAEVLVGGGVCIEPAERMDDVASSSKPVFKGVSCVSDVRLQGRFEVDEGFGEEDRRREVSTGGSVCSGLGDRW